MKVTPEDLRNFTSFANEKLENGGARTMFELVHAWESQRVDGNPIEVDRDAVRALAEFFPDVPDADRRNQAVERKGGVTTAEMLGKAMLAAIRAGRA